MTDGPTLSDLAPWPGMTGPATADILARYYSVRGHAAASRLHSGEHDDTTRTLLLAVMTDSFGTALLLRAFPADRADEIAGLLREHLEDGMSVGECLWEWLEGYGIDPEQVSRIAAATAPASRLKEMQAEIEQLRKERAAKEALAEAYRLNLEDLSAIATGDGTDAEVRQQFLARLTAPKNEV